MTAATGQVVDQPSCRPGEYRCRHDMLVIGGRSTCSWCLGLPDVPTLDAAVDGSVRPLNPAGYESEEGTLRWVATEDPTRCVSCDAPLRAGYFVAYVAELNGSIGRCCEGLAS